MENLFTDGSELKLPNGRRYRGYYHVHPTRGAMVGAKHVNRQHPVLQPINKLVKQKLEKMQGIDTPVVPPPSPVVPTPVKPQQTTTRPTATPVKPISSQAVRY